MLVVILFLSMQQNLQTTTSNPKALCFLVFTSGFFTFLPLKLDLFLLQAVGEPPLFLASSVFYAIKDAVMAAR